MCRCFLIYDSKYGAVIQNLIHQIPLQMAFTWETETNNKLTVCTLHRQHQQNGFINEKHVWNIIIINHSCLPAQQKHVPIDGVRANFGRRKTVSFGKTVMPVIFSGPLYVVGLSGALHFTYTSVNHFVHHFISRAIRLCDDYVKFSR